MRFGSKLAVYNKPQPPFVLVKRRITFRMEGNVAPYLLSLSQTFDPSEIDNCCWELTCPTAGKADVVHRKEVNHLLRAGN